MEQTPGETEEESGRERKTASSRHRERGRVLNAADKGEKEGDFIWCSECFSKIVCSSQSRGGVIGVTF